jgi:hypothetical protein
MTDDSEEMRKLWDGLSGAARETLICLCKHGPTWDGDIPSKTGRGELFDKGMASRCVMGDQWQSPRSYKGFREQNEQGFSCANYLGSRVYKYGYVDPRKDIVRKLVPDPSLIRRGM